MTRAPAGGVNPPGPPPAMSWGARCPASPGTEGGGLVVVTAGRAAAPGPASCPAVAPAQSPPVASAPTRPATHSRPGSPAPGSPALDPPWRPAACPGCGLCSGSFWNQTLWAPSRPVPPPPRTPFPLHSTGAKEQHQRHQPHSLLLGNASVPSPPWTGQPVTAPGLLAACAPGLRPTWAVPGARPGEDAKRAASHTGWTAEARSVRRRSPWRPAGTTAPLARLCAAVTATDLPGHVRWARRWAQGGAAGRPCRREGR